ncbi:MAG TPA: class I SAM-dependent rRNA methyltransferase [Edaphocola sp.]|nr:class I SAM-dependent rRNA methyltransferase [Edaphocola sp.]
MAKVFLKKKITGRIADGHPWVYSNEIGDIVGDCKSGDVVDLFSHLGSFIGRGFINTEAQIKVRILVKENISIDANFISQRIKEAWNYRQQLGLIENCRLVHSESDGLPGLVIEKFNDYFVIQTLNVGIDLWKDTIVQTLNTIFSPKGIYERNDAPVRQIEGLPLQKGFLSSKFDTLIKIKENGIDLLVDIENGMKTGYFLDRNDVRKEIIGLVKNARVLDAFCYTGSFGILAAKSGAKSVYGIDFMPDVINLAKQNVVLNKLEKNCNFECENAFDELKRLTKEQACFDMVILDPPTFVKNKENLDRALSGYKEINLRALKLLAPKGYLVTASMSNLINQELFLNTIKDAAKDAKRQIKQIYFGTQTPDHSILWSMPHSEYLKFLIVQVL